MDLLIIMCCISQKIVQILRQVMVMATHWLLSNNRLLNMSINVCQPSNASFVGIRNNRDLYSLISYFDIKEYKSLCPVCPLYQVFLKLHTAIHFIYIDYLF